MQRHIATTERKLILMERTLSIIKPDGVARGLIGEVVKRLEGHDLRIIAMKMIHMTRAQAEGFYAVHKERPFFGSLTEFMSSGPCVEIGRAHV